MTITGPKHNSEFPKVEPRIPFYGKYIGRCPARLSLAAPKISHGTSHCHAAAWISLSLLRENHIAYDLTDERIHGQPLEVSLAGTLRMDQEAAVSAMLHHDAGVLCAPTAFGKTVSAAAMIARRGVNALVLVYRTELLKQWQERLLAFLAVDKGMIGVIGG